MNPLRNQLFLTLLKEAMMNHEPLLRNCNLMNCFNTSCKYFVTVTAGLSIEITCYSSGTQLLVGPSTRGLMTAAAVGVGGSLLVSQ